MIDLEVGLWVDTGCGDVGPGSPQCVHLFTDHAGRSRYRERSPITDAFDHSYVVLSENAVSVEWANATGDIQLCGSGALAAAYLLSQVATWNSCAMATPGQSLSFDADEHRVTVALPLVETVPVYTKSGSPIDAALNAGVFLWRVHSEETLLAQGLSEQCHFALGDYDMHSLCCYHWDEESNRGQLRYFVPRYGRDEDYVTGSIHAYLAPVIRERFGRDHQHWWQRSTKAGELSVRVTDQAVTISGDCRIQPQHEVDGVREALLGMLSRL